MIFLKQSLTGSVSNRMSFLTNHQVVLMGLIVLSYEYLVNHSIDILLWFYIFWEHVIGSSFWVTYTLCGTNRLCLQCWRDEGRKGVGSFYLKQPNTAVNKLLTWLLLDFAIWATVSIAIHFEKIAAIKAAPILLDALSKEWTWCHMDIGFASGVLAWVGEAATFDSATMSW